MTNDELDKVFLLLRQFYTQHPFWKDKNRQLAYRLALEPYAYGDVKESVLRVVRRTRNFPLISELTEGLVIPADEEEPTPEEAADDEMNDKFDRQIERKYGSWAGYRAYLQRLIDALEAK